MDWPDWLVAPLNQVIVYNSRLAFMSCHELQIVRHFQAQNPSDVGKRVVKADCANHSQSSLAACNAWSTGNDLESAG